MYSFSRFISIIGWFDLLLQKQYSLVKRTFKFYGTALNQGVMFCRGLRFRETEFFSDGAIVFSEVIISPRYLYFPKMLITFSVCVNVSLWTPLFIPYLLVLLL